MRPHPSLRIARSILWASTLALHIVFALACGEAEPDVEVVPCDTRGCVSSDLPGKGCEQPGEECETIDCHFNPAETYICENGIWTAESDLFFYCGPFKCTVGPDRCEQTGDVYRCAPNR